MLVWYGSANRALKSLSRFNSPGKDTHLKNSSSQLSTTTVLVYIALQTYELYSNLQTD